MIVPSRTWNAISSGAFNGYAIASDGTIWGWGLSPLGAGRGGSLLFPTQYGPGSNWVAVSANDYLAMALRRDGTLWAAGANAGPYLATGFFSMAPSGLFTQWGADSNWVEVITGPNGFAARRRDSSWVVFGGFSPSIPERSGDRARDGSYPMPASFDPWAICFGYEGGAVFNRDGALWSFGTHLGVEGKRPVLERMGRSILWLFGHREDLSSVAAVEARPSLLWRLGDRVSVPVTNAPSPIRPSER